MHAYAIRDESGEPIGFGCGWRPPTEGDIETVRAFASTLVIPAFDDRVRQVDELDEPGA